MQIRITLFIFVLAWVLVGCGEQATPADVPEPVETEVSADDSVDASEDDSVPQDAEAVDAESDETSDADMEMPDMVMGATSAAYMDITNNGTSDVFLIGGSADLAAEVQLHETIIEDGVASMVPQGDGILIEAGETVSLQPGGLHIMLASLEGDLVEGETTGLTLNFTNGEEVTLDLPIAIEAPAENTSIEAGDLVIEAFWTRPASLGNTDTNADMEATEESE